MNEFTINRIHELYSELASMAISSYIYGDDNHTESRAIEGEIDHLLDQLVPCND